jgi:hypothetical protein
MVEVLSYSSLPAPPRWLAWAARNPRWPFLLVYLCAAAVILWLFRIPEPFAGVMISFVVLLAVGTLWLVRVVLQVLLIWRFKLPHPGLGARLRAYLLPVAIILIAGICSVTSLSFRACLWLSQGALEAQAQKLLMGQPVIAPATLVGPKHAWPGVGLMPVSQSFRLKGYPGVFFRTPNSGFLDDMGVLYCPGAFTPDKTLSEEPVTGTHLFGPWYTYKRDIL